MVAIFSPATPLEHAVHAGEHAQALALLRVLPRGERIRHRDSARRMVALLDEAGWNARDETYAGWGMRPLEAQVRAALTVLVVCGTAQDVASRFFRSRDDLVALCSEFQPESLHGLAEAMLARSPRAIETVQALIVAGLAPRPESDDYLVGLISLPYTRRFAELWAADPGLRDVLPRIMEIEGSSELNLAAVDKYTGRDATWSSTLLRLCAEGVYSRISMLDSTLDALERDWPQFRSSWFSRFHAALAPELPLLAERAARYLALCHSRIPPTVTLALAVLKRLTPLDVVDDAELLDALRPVMHAVAKGQVLAALKLVDGCIERDRGLADTAATMLVGALVHESPDVQGHVLQRLARWGGEDLRDRLLPYADGIAAVHRADFAMLAGLGDVAPVEPERSAAMAAPHGTGPLRPDDETRGLQPPPDIDVLVSTIAHVFENDTDIDAFEMAAAGLVQAVPFDALYLERFSPLIKRAQTVRGPLAGELAGLLLALATGTCRPMQPVHDDHGENNATQLCLAARTRAWISIAQRGLGLPPLSMPTHRGGFIAARALVERASQYQRAGVDAGLEEQVRALLRLAASSDETVVAAAMELRDGPFPRALRYALGDHLYPEAGHAALFVAAARIRFPDEHDQALLAMLGDIGPDGALAARYSWRVDTWHSQAEGKTYTHSALVVDAAPAPRAAGHEFLAVHRHYAAIQRATGSRALHNPGFGGTEESLLRLSATLLPSCLEAHFADGVRAIGNNLDWWQAQWADRVYLERLLDPAVAMGPMPTLLLALGLAAKEPGQLALSVDALVVAWSEARLDADALARELRALSATPHVKASRYARSLRAALRADPTTHPLVFKLLCEMVVASPAEPQRDIALLFDIVLELVLAHGHVLPDATRRILQDMGAKGRARQLVKRVLAA